MNASIAQLSSKQFRAAAEIKDKIDSLQAELNALLSGASSETPVAETATPGRRKMSAAGRAAIAAGVRARWAKINTEKVSAGSTKGSRKMSAAAKARISAAAKLRWKKAKAAGKNSL